ncbi:MAG: iron-containing alcohol dehydrogenase [Treponema sp.]|nr:iron-containing alcohol dehydrogenase [Treponema sp.]
MDMFNIPGLEECLAAARWTRALVIGKGVYREVSALLDAEYGSKRVFLIADENTMDAAGSGLEQTLNSSGIEITGRHIFPAEPRLHAEYKHIETLKEKFAALMDTSSQPLVPAAVGSGTINDLVKRAAGELSLPYLCIPTAASVDGFTAAGAAILKDDFKQTLSCSAPLCIAADTGVLSCAPAWLSSSGFGDLAGKICAGADWIIADAAAPAGAKWADPIEDKAWAMVQNGLHGYLDRSVTAAEGDEDALKALFEALSITGFTMQYANDSRPVSGAEHLFAHIWEMEDLSVSGIPVTHGHKVAIGSLADTAFLETLFADPKNPPPPPGGYRHPAFDERIAEVKSAFAHSPALESVIKTVTEKYPDEKTAANVSMGIRDQWKELRAKVLEQLIPYGELKAVLIKARCPVLPKEINLDRSAIFACARRAQMIRKRYNGLDLAWDLGCFQTVLARMETSGGYF